MAFEAQSVVDSDVLRLDVVWVFDLLVLLLDWSVVRLCCLPACTDVHLLAFVWGVSHVGQWGSGQMVIQSFLEGLGGESCGLRPLKHDLVVYVCSGGLLSSRFVRLYRGGVYYK